MCMIKLSIKSNKHNIESLCLLDSWDMVENITRKTIQMGPNGAQNSKQILNLAEIKFMLTLMPI
jgi:hypothetical protein